MKKLIMATCMLFVLGCSEDNVLLPDNIDLIEANAAAIQLNGELDALLADRVSALEERMTAVEADIVSIGLELDALGDETEENADAIAKLKRKLRRHKREQANINRANALQFSRLRRVISSIQRDIVSLVRSDRRLASKLRDLSGQIDSLRRAIYRNTRLDLQRLQLVMRMFQRVGAQLTRLSFNQISIVEGCEEGEVYLDTPEGLVGIVIDGYYQDVLYAQGDFVPLRTWCTGPWWNRRCHTTPAHISVGEVVEIFVTTDVSLQLLDEELTCDEESNDD